MRLERPGWRIWGALLIACWSATSSLAQGPPEAVSPAPTVSPDREAPGKVEIHPTARDRDIGERLERILAATGWFAGPQVRVEEGVVFLQGRADSDARRKWAGELARGTQDVVAVVNRMEVAEPDLSDFSAAQSGLRELWRDLVRSLPLLAFGLLILGLSFFVSMLVTGRVRHFLRSRVSAQILRNVIARGVGVLAFLLGVYIVLRVSGLTQLALTVIGGTGLIGLVLGIAFRTISENFLASIFLSMQQPFATGDLVEIDGVMGYVQQLNVRTTILMSPEGNLVQIPNATVYQSNLTNFTANANRRNDFIIGIGYDDSINRAQEIAREVLATHPAVLPEPKPWVLVDSLGSATVNLRVYFWLNGREHSWQKVRSSVIRLVKHAFQESGISMPDEAREMIFPQGVPVTLLEREAPEKAGLESGTATPAKVPAGESKSASTEAEAGLSSEAGVLEEQARDAQALKEGENLLGGSSRE